MNEELCEKLKTAYPNLYKHTHNIECGDGWYEIIDELSAGLEKIIVSLKDKCDPDFVPAACQVKEKFGGLRFYMYSESDVMSDLIYAAQDKSFRTCESCGKPGKVVCKNKWFRTTCGEHL